MGKIIENTGKLLYKDANGIVYRAPYLHKPIEANLKDRKIVRQYIKHQGFMPAIIDFVNKIIKLPNKNPMTIALVHQAINTNATSKNKATMYAVDYGCHIAISEDEISLINPFRDEKGIPAVLTNSLMPASNMFLIYHEDKLLFVL